MTRKRDLMRGQRIAKERTQAAIVHITQDDYGYWMMSLETADGQLHLMMSLLEDVEDPVGHAYNPDELDLPADTMFLVSEDVKPIQLHHPDWNVPEPRRAAKPYYVVEGGVRTDG